MSDARETRKLRRRPDKPFAVRWECCPCCGHQRFSQHLIGWDEGATQGRDPNRRGCDECGCQWYAPEIVQPGVPEEQRPVYQAREKR